MEEQLGPLFWMISSLVMVVVPALLNLRAWADDRRLAQKLHRESQEPVDLPELPEYPHISFLVAAWNESGLVQRCIRSVLALPYPNLELVLCAGGLDDTYDLALQAADDPRLTVLEQHPGEGKQKALQRCLEASDGEIIYLIDADCLIDQRAFDLCLGPILEDREDVVTGGFIYPIPEQMNQAFALAQVAGFAYRIAHQTEESQGIMGANCALDRKTLKDGGDFLNPVRSGTDYDLAIRIRKLGKRIRLEKQAYIQTKLDVKVGAYVRQQRRWLRNLFLHGKLNHDRNLVIGSLRSTFLGLMMISIPLLVIFLGIIGGLAAKIGAGFALIWGLLFFHAFFSRLRYQAFAIIWPGIQFPNWWIPLLPAFIILDFLAWTTPLLAYLRKSSRESW